MFISLRSWTEVHLACRRCTQAPSFASAVNTSPSSPGLCPLPLAYCSPWALTWPICFSFLAFHGPFLINTDTRAPSQALKKLRYLHSVWLASEHTGQRLRWELPSSQQETDLFETVTSTAHLASGRDFCCCFPSPFKYREAGKIVAVFGWKRIYFPSRASS